MDIRRQIYELLGKLFAPFGERLLTRVVPDQFLREAQNLVVVEREVERDARWLSDVPRGVDECFRPIAFRVVGVN